MDEARLERIKALLGSANRDRVGRSAARWEAARLLWEEIDAGTSHLEIASATGFHRNHIRWMAAVWALALERDFDTSDYRALPSFNTLYNSAEIRQPNGPRQLRVRVPRGDRAERDDQGDQGDHGEAPLRGARAEDDRADYGSSLVNQIVENVVALETHTAAQALINADGLKALRDAAARLRAIASTLKARHAA